MRQHGKSLIKSKVSAYAVISLLAGLIPMERVGKEGVALAIFLQGFLLAFGEEI